MDAYAWRALVAVLVYYMHCKTLTQLLESAKTVERDRDDNSDLDSPQATQHLKKRRCHARHKGNDCGYYRRASASLPDVTAISGGPGGGGGGGGRAGIDGEDRRSNGPILVDGIPAGLPRLHPLPEGMPRSDYSPEEESESESEIRFVDLDEDTLHNVLSRVDENTLGRAGCVNKLWLKVAQDEQLWEPIWTRLLLSSGGYGLIDLLRDVTCEMGGFRQFYNSYLWPLSKSPPSDFYSIDPQVFQPQPFSDFAVASVSRLGPDFPTIVLPGFIIWRSPQGQLRLRFKVAGEAKNSSVVTK